MKKILTLVLSCFVIAGFSQSAIKLLDENDALIDGTIVDINMTPSSSHTEEVFVTNTGSTAEVFKVRRTVLMVDASDATQFCWGGLCYGFTTNVSSLTLTINPGDTLGFVDGGFHALYTTGSAVGTRLVHYNFFDNTDSNDSTGVTLRYNVSVGINESVKADGNIYNAFPNPATALISVKYDMNQYADKGKIVFHDMLGKKVKELELTDKQGTAKISVADLNAGVYFYTLMVNDKAIATKKIVVSQK